MGNKIYFDPKSNQLISKTLVTLERGDNILTSNMLLEDLLRQLTFQRSFSETLNFDLHFPRYKSFNFPEFGEEVLSDLANWHVKFGVGELDFSFFKV